MNKTKTNNPYNDAIDEINSWLEKYKTILSPYEIMSILAQYAGHVAFLTTRGTDEETYNLIKYCLDKGKKSADFGKKNGYCFLFFENEK